MLIAVLYIQHCPLIYYAYAGFPIFFWEEVLANRETLQQGLRVLMQGDGKYVSLLTIASQSIIYVGILESLVPPPAREWLTVGIWILSSSYFQYLFCICGDVAVYLWH